MQSLSNGYIAEVDRITESEWSDLLTRFDDASIYQTWSYGSIRWGKSNISHLVLKKKEEIVAAVQSRIIKIPIVNAGIAYIIFGPLWMLHGRQKDLETFRQIIRALYREYVMKRGLLLRIIPNQINNGTEILQSILEEEGLKWQKSTTPYKTFLIDLSLSREELRKSLNQKWRNCLNHAERNGLTVINGIKDNLYEVFTDIYRKMHKRKKFIELIDINKIRSVQNDLQDHLKMIIMLCKFQDEPVAAIVCSAIGDTGIYFLGASNETGRKLYASYLLQWLMIELLKERGYRWYDLGGINPQKNPGTLHFKRGLAGRSGKEVQYLGQFDGCQSLLSSFLVKLGDQLRILSQKRKYALVKVFKKEH